MSGSEEDRSPYERGANVKQPPQYPEYLVRRAQMTHLTNRRRIFVLEDAIDRVLSGEIPLVRVREFLRATFAESQRLEREPLAEVCRGL